MRSLLLLSVVALCSAGVFKVQLKHFESRRLRMTREGTWAKYLDMKNHARLNKAVIGQPVNDYEDLEYVGNVTTGTPQQMFQVILDTGSANYWVPDTTCNGAPCQNKNKFNSGASSTYTRNGQTWSIQYGTGSARGFLGVDTVAFGSIGAPQLEIPTTTFGQATSIAAFFQDEPIDGILGQAFQSLAVDNVVPPLVNAINKNLLDDTYFTVWLAQRGIADNVPNAGMYTYGGMDTTNCGALMAWQPLTSATYFQFRMTNIGIGSYNSNTAQDVISDTGTSFIGGPTAIVQRLAAQVNAQYNAAEETYYMSCNQTGLQTLDIVIGSNTYSINPNNYVIDSGGPRCYFAVFPFNFGGFGPAWILGDPFIRQYCNMYDLGRNGQGARIGFAMANAR
jgi:hypothetical protein